MGIRGWNVVVLAAVGSLWLASGTQREKPVVAPPTAEMTGEMAALEADVASNPNDAAATRKLAQAYLDARSPGLALSVVSRAPAAVRVEPTVDHVYARALLDEGRAEDALAAERRVLDRCSANDGTCDAWLVASATRRVSILEQLVQLGIEDAQAHPEASAVAYHNATRDVRLAFQ